MIVSWAHGPRAEANPWRALTLEWQVSSPPPIFNFDEIPQSSAARTSTACRARAGRGAPTRMSTPDEPILVVANETSAAAR
jgi:heme/copper-type cytochrome/quinol oxidase subunit 1